MPAARARPSVAILGCGAVGGALAWDLAEGWKRARRRAELWLWSRHSKSVEELSEELTRFPVRVRALSVPEDSLGASEAVLLCLPDAVIVPLAKRLAHAVAPRRPAHPAVLHTNGFLGPDALSALKRKGVAVGKLHPFWAANRNSTLLEDVSFGIEGDPRALRAARSIVHWIGGKPIALSRGAGPQYHAAASLFSGGIVALYELADQLLARAVPTLDSRRRAMALDELASSTLNNVWFNGAKVGLTGAIARGAEDIVRGHLRALRREPNALEAYQVLGRTMLELARARGSIDAGTHRRLARLLRAPARKR